MDTTIHNASGLPIHISGSKGQSPCGVNPTGAWFDAVVDYPEGKWRKSRVVGGSKTAKGAYAIAYRWVLKNADWLV